MSKDFQSSLQVIVEQLDPAFHEQGHKTIEALLQAKVNSYEDLLVILQDQAAETEIREIVCWILARLNAQQAVPFLLETLHDQNSSLRRAAAQSLGELGDQRSVQLLITSMAKDEDEDVRMFAAQALGLLGNGSAFEPLINTLGEQDESPKVRGMAAEALADLRDKRAVDSLIASLSDPNAEVRFWAAFALGELGDPQALPELEQLAATDNSYLPSLGSVKEQVLEAIQYIQSKRV